MASAPVLWPFHEIKVGTDEGSLAIIENEPFYLYYSGSNTPQNEIYEIIDSDEEDFGPEESFAMSVKIENTLRYLNIIGAKIESPSKVLDYLYRYPEVVDLAQYAAELVAKRFGSDVKLSFEVYQDRGAQFENLILYIRQYDYNSNIMKTIKEIRKEYGISFPRAKGRFLLTTDFRQPR